MKYPESRVSVYLSSTLHQKHVDRIQDIVITAMDDVSGTNLLPMARGIITPMPIEVSIIPILMDQKTMTLVRVGRGGNGIIRLMG